MNSTENQEHSICSNSEVNKNLSNIYKLIKDGRYIDNNDKTVTGVSVIYEPRDLTKYFRSMYTLISRPQYSQLLFKAECININKFYGFLCNENGMGKKTTDNIDDIVGNCVINIKIPAVPGSYHYITAVIDKPKKYVDIYQSYGGTRTLYDVLNLPFNDFKILLQDCKSLTNKESNEIILDGNGKEESNYLSDMKKLRRISRVLSRIFDLECKALQNNESYFNYDYEDDYEEEDEEEQEDEEDIDNGKFDLRKLMDINYPPIPKISQDNKDLGFSNPEAIYIIEKDYNTFKNNPEKFSMDIFTPTIGGYRMKRTKKNMKKRTTRKNYKIKSRKI
jgi:hypothetical protein